VRSEPDNKLIRDLWLLLPTASRRELWPATFAFDTRLAFDAVVMPPSRSPFTSEEGVKAARSMRYITEEQAADFPEGRYELSLQTAAEAGDQASLDALFARGTRRDVLRWTIICVVIVAVLVALIQWLPVPKPDGNRPPDTKADTKSGTSLTLPPVEKYPKLSDDERQRLTEALAELARERGLALGEAVTAEDYLTALDRHLGTPDAKRVPGELARWGPVQRQVQALAWKHGLPEYSDPALSSPELVERLQRKLAGKKP
jgi:hypothetical protein